MKASNTLKNLNKENSLIIVTGTHVAKVYQLKGGRIFQKPTVNIPNSRLTDREGIRRREGEGTIWGTASDYEQHDDNVKIEFMHQLQKELKEVLREQNPDSLYIFSPTSTIAAVKEMVPKAARKKINMEYTGNFTKSQPNDLLEKINKKRAKEVAGREKLKPQTAKILNRKKVHNNSK